MQQPHDYVVVSCWYFNLDGCSWLFGTWMRWNWLQELEEISGSDQWISQARWQQNASVVAGEASWLCVFKSQPHCARTTQWTSNAGQESQGKENARRPFDCALFLSKQGLAFLGHDESQTFSNRGNFLELVHFLSKYSQQLHRWLESQRGNMSPDIRDKKIAIDAKKMRCSLSRKSTLKRTDIVYTC